MTLRSFALSTQDFTHVASYLVSNQRTYAIALWSLHLDFKLTFGDLTRTAWIRVTRPWSRTLSFVQTWPSTVGETIMYCLMTPKNPKKFEPEKFEDFVLSQGIQWDHLVPKFTLLLQREMLQGAETVVECLCKQITCTYVIVYAVYWRQGIEADRVLRETACITHSGLPGPYASEHARLWLHWPQHPFIGHHFPYR